MPDQRLPQSARNRLSPGQVYCLAWAARPGTSRPPLEHFGVPKNGWAGGYIVTPRTSRATWISLRARGLVQMPHDDYNWQITALGVAWLKLHGLYDKALENL